MMVIPTERVMEISLEQPGGFVLQVSAEGVTWQVNRLGLFTARIGFITLETPNRDIILLKDASFTEETPGSSWQCEQDGVTYTLFYTLSPLGQLLAEPVFEEKDLSLQLWDTESWQVIGRVSKLELDGDVLIVSFIGDKTKIRIDIQAYPVSLLEEEHGYAITTSETTYNFLREGGHLISFDVD